MKKRPTRKTAPVSFINHYDSIRDAIDDRMHPQRVYKLTMEYEIDQDAVTDADDDGTLDHLRQYGAVAITKVEEVK